MQNPMLILVVLSPFGPYVTIPIAFVNVQYIVKPRVESCWEETVGADKRNHNR